MNIRNFSNSFSEGNDVVKNSKLDIKWQASLGLPGFGSIEEQDEETLIQEYFDANDHESKHEIDEQPIETNSNTKKETKLKNYYR